MWCINKKGEKEFKGGRENFIMAALEGNKCKNFKYDDEDEWVSDEPKSCYNCQFRRWTANSFICCKPL